MCSNTASKSGRDTHRKRAQKKSMWNKDNYKKYGLRLLSAGVIAMFAAVLTQDACQQSLQRRQEAAYRMQQQQQKEAAIHVGAYAQTILDLNKLLQEQQIDLKSVAEKKETDEESVYTFLQGPKSWSEGRTWSGEWSMRYFRKNSFGGFGCGLCCMANIYSTLSPYICSPMDMFEYATQVSAYYPTSQSGAIGWEDMNTTLNSAGLDSQLYVKPATYEEFQQQMEEASSAIVLVSSNNDDTYWKETKGHYVNIWLYNSETDEVFLAEPGSPTNNRSWIPLRYVYDALKTVSQYQYLMVDGYEEEQNGWKWNGIDDNWIAP